MSNNFQNYFYSPLYFFCFDVKRLTTHFFVIAPKMVTLLEASPSCDMHVVAIKWMVGFHAWLECIFHPYMSFIVSQPPPPSSRPPVTGYKISHNITGSAVTLNQTNDTNFTAEGVAPGVYFFAVLAVNTFGDGNTSITGKCKLCHKYLIALDTCSP